MSDPLAQVNPPQEAQAPAEVPAQQPAAATVENAAAAPVVTAPTQNADDCHLSYNMVHPEARLGPQTQVHAYDFSKDVHQAPAHAMDSNGHARRHSLHPDHDTLTHGEATYQMRQAVHSTRSDHLNTHPVNVVPALGKRHSLHHNNELHVQALQNAAAVHKDDMSKLNFVQAPTQTQTANAAAAVAAAPASAAASASAVAPAPAASTIPAPTTGKSMMGGAVMASSAAAVAAPVEKQVDQLLTNTQIPAPVAVSHPALTSAPVAEAAPAQPPAKSAEPTKEEQLAALKKAGDEKQKELQKSVEQQLAEEQERVNQLEKSLATVRKGFANSGFGQAVNQKTEQQTAQIQSLAYGVEAWNAGSQLRKYGHSSQHNVTMEEAAKQQMDACAPLAPSPKVSPKAMHKSENPVASIFEKYMPIPNTNQFYGKGSALGLRDATEPLPSPDKKKQEEKKPNFWDQIQQNKQYQEQLEKQMAAQLAQAQSDLNFLKGQQNEDVLKIEKRLQELKASEELTRMEIQKDQQLLNAASQMVKVRAQAESAGIQHKTPAQVEAQAEVEFLLKKIEANQAAGKRGMDALKVTPSTGGPSYSAWHQAQEVIRKAAEDNKKADGSDKNEQQLSPMFKPTFDALTQQMQNLESAKQAVIAANCAVTGQPLPPVGSSAAAANIGEKKSNVDEKQNDFSLGAPKLAVPKLNANSNIFDYEDPTQKLAPSCQDSTLKPTFYFNDPFQGGRTDPTLNSTLKPDPEPWSSPELRAATDKLEQLRRNQVLQNLKNEELQKNVRLIEEMNKSVVSFQEPKRAIFPTFGDDKSKTTTSPQKENSVVQSKLQQVSREVTSLSQCYANLKTDDFKSEGQKETLKFLNDYNKVKEEEFKNNKNLLEKILEQQKMAFNKGRRNSIGIDNDACSDDADYFMQSKQPPQVELIQKMIGDLQAEERNRELAVTLEKAMLENQANQRKNEIAGLVEKMLGNKLEEQKDLTNAAVIEALINKAAKQNGAEKEVTVSEILQRLKSQNKSTQDSVVKQIVDSKQPEQQKLYDRNSVVGASSKQQQQQLPSQQPEIDWAKVLAPANPYEIIKKQADEAIAKNMAELKEERERLDQEKAAMECMKTTVSEEVKKVIGEQQNVAADNSSSNVVVATGVPSQSDKAKYEDEVLKSAIAAALKRASEEAVAVPVVAPEPNDSSADNKEETSQSASDNSAKVLANVYGSSDVAQFQTVIDAIQQRTNQLETVVGRIDARSKTDSQQLRSVVSKVSALTEAMTSMDSRQSAHAENHATDFDALLAKLNANSNGIKGFEAKFNKLNAVEKTLNDVTERFDKAIDVSSDLATDAKGALQNVTKDLQLAQKALQDMSGKLNSTNTQMDNLRDDFQMSNALNSDSADSLLIMHQALDKREDALRQKLSSLEDRVSTFQPD